MCTLIEKKKQLFPKFRIPVIFDRNSGVHANVEITFVIKITQIKECVVLMFGQSFQYTLGNSQDQQ